MVTSEKDCIKSPAMAYSDEGSVGPDWDDILDGVDLPLVVDMSHWIGCITRTTLPYDMFMERITDGIILCNFGNTINAMTGFGAKRQISNILYPDTEGQDESFNRHNIACFLQWCKTYGLNKDWLFSVSDLADKGDGRKILRSLLWIGRIAHRRGVPAPQIVKIEEKYEMRYYTFIKHIIPETPIPASVIFREDEQFPEKRSSTLSVKSFFGRSSVNSMSSRKSLSSISEKKGKTLGFGKLKKKKKAVDELVEEQDFITPNTEIQQIYMQLMTMMYHKGFQRAKPKGYVGIAMEDWQTELHSASASDLPDEEFEFSPAGGWSVGTRSPSPYGTVGTPGSRNVTPTPTSDFYLNTYSIDAPKEDPLGERMFLPIKEAQELSSFDETPSSDGAFADDDKNRGSVVPRVEEIIHNVYPASASIGELREEGREEGQEETDNQIRGEDDMFDDEPSHSVNPSLADDENFTKPYLERKDSKRSRLISGGSSRAGTPDTLEQVIAEQSIKDSDVVDEEPIDVGRPDKKGSKAKYGSIHARTRQESTYSRQSSSGRRPTGEGAAGLSFGQVMLLIVCPCRLCFGKRGPVS